MDWSCEAASHKRRQLLYLIQTGFHPRPPKQTTEVWFKKTFVNYVGLEHWRVVNIIIRIKVCRIWLLWHPETNSTAGIGHILLSMAANSSKHSHAVLVQVPKQSAVGEMMIIPHTLYPMGMALNSLGMINTSHTEIPSL